MKRIILIIIMISAAFIYTSAQSNTFPSSGNVGIGTTSPSQQLDVRGHIYTTGSVFIDGGDLVLKRTTTAYGYVARPNVSGYKKLQFAVEGGGPLEDLYVNAERSIFAGNVNTGDAFDATSYGNLQLVRPANQGDNRFHLSFIREGNNVSGMGYAPNSSLLGIWYATSNAGTPLMSFTIDQKVGIGTSDPGSYKLAVEGKIAAREIKVTLASFADYVFDKKYKLLSLNNLEKFIQQNKHLPNIPSAKDVEENKGIELGDMNVKLLEKIEELTLYIIQLNKKIELLEKRKN
ncbi:MAG: hypothetical protein WDN26_14035 [Chitinophagaceae bacterium]